MSETTRRERLEAEGSQILERVKQLIHEGNIRRVVITQGEQTVAEFPLTAGVVGVVVAPVLAAIGVLAALLTHCTIEVERVQADEPESVDRQADELEPVDLQAVAESHPRD
jgi:hypothetical protein